ncbi:MAG: hypothetical protein L0Z70_03080 [Chloroflexi bacterium]|nr:hypothetical protein [Chloroflexota bacterium]
MMNLKRSQEIALYLAVFALALAARLLNLGLTPLLDGEAALAWQAMNLLKDAPSPLLPHPAYLSLSGLSFAFFGATDFMARLWPALMGSLLALIPVAFRGYLGRFPALLLALGLALDPGLAAVSRLVGGPALALSFTLLALGLANAGKSAAAGVAAGLALLSGPGVIPGWLGLGLAWALDAWLARREETFQQMAIQVNWRTFFIAGGSALLLGGTCFMLSPRGLGAWAAGLPAYFSGWLTPSGVPALRLLGALAIYQPLALIFGLAGALRAWLKFDRFNRLLSVWFTLALLLALLYPARQTADLIWAIVPLWALAAGELARSFAPAGEKSVIPWVQGALVVILLTLIWTNVAVLSRGGITQQDIYLRLGVIFGAAALAAVSAALVGLGWSWAYVRLALSWAVFAALGLYGVSALWASTQPELTRRFELWRPTPLTADADLLVDTIADLSAWQTGEDHSIDIAVAVNSPALRWALRDYPRAAFMENGLILGGGASPSLAITRQDDAQPALSAAYRGQDFAWRAYPAWETPLPPNFFFWLTLHQAPLMNEQVILWARADLFPGGLEAPAPPPVDYEFDFQEE